MAPCTCEYRQSYEWNYVELPATKVSNGQHAKGRGHDALRFAYLDSGPPVSSCPSHDEDIQKYTTVVCIHGHTYTARTFERALSVASKGMPLPIRQNSRVRLIALNRRDYVPTTPLTSAELAQLFTSTQGAGSKSSRHQAQGTGAESTHASASSLAKTETHEHRNHLLYLRARAIELARVLVWFSQHVCEKNGAVSSTNGSEEIESDLGGELAVLGWSLGTVYVLALLAFLREHPGGSSEGLTMEEDQLRRVLKKIMARAFLLEPLPTFLGYACPTGPQYFNPINDASNDPNVGIKIDAWIRSYNYHWCFSTDDGIISSNASRLAPIRDDAFVTKIDNDEILASGLDTSRHSNISEEEKEKGRTQFSSALLACLDSAPGPRSEIAIYTHIARETLAEVRRAAFGLDGSNGRETRENGEENEGVMPPVTVMYGGASLWTAPWTVRKIAQELRNARKEKSLDRVDFFRLPGGNHMVVWDEPVKFVRALAECLDPNAQNESKM